MLTVTVTMAELTGLTPFSQYTFYVTTENAMSSLDPDIGNRSSNIFVSTLEGGNLILS